MEASLTESTKGNMVVICALSQRSYAIYMQEVSEIIKVAKITPVPLLPFYIDGLMNLRNEVIPVIHLENRMTQLSKEIDDIELLKPTHRRAINVKKDRVIVMKVEEEQVGIRVDEIRSIRRIDKEDYFESKDDIYGFDHQLYTGFLKIEGEIIPILNSAHIVGIEH